MTSKREIRAALRGLNTSDLRGLAYDQGIDPHGLTRSQIIDELLGEDSSEPTTVMLDEHGLPHIEPIDGRWGD